MLHSVMWVCLCIPRDIHCSCSTAMALLCIPVSELVSFAFSTIPICPFLIHRMFSFICNMGDIRAKNYEVEGSRMSELIPCKWRVQV